MAAPLIPFSIQNPGSKGLNTQDSTEILEWQWASELTNAVFDNSGRAATRKGFTVLTTSSSFGAYDLEQVHCWENEGNTVVISAGNADILYGTTTLTSIKGTLTPSADNWQFQNWIDSSGNTKIVAWQSGETPIVSTVTGTTPGNFADISPSAGTLPTGNCCLAAFGRIWASDSDGTTVKYSGLLDEANWSTGGSGSLNTLHYWPGGVDYVTAIAAWEDRLIVFGKRNILIYDNPDDISNFPALVDTVEGVGCVARDSVQNIGSDIIFLSETGLRSLRRTIETEKNPLQEVGVQVRDELVSYINGNEDVIRSVYNQEEGFYLLVIPDSADPVAFMFDVKSLQTRDLFGRQIFDLSNVRVSKWIGWKATGVAYGRNGIMYGGFRDSTDSNEGVIGSYSGYLDNTSTFTFSYWSPWIDFTTQEDGQGGAFYKILKSLKTTIVGGTGYTITVRWAYDYQDTFYSSNFVVPDGGVDTSEWGESEFGVAEWGYSVTSTVTRKSVATSSHGDIFRMGISFTVNEDPLSLQRMDAFLKRGRVSR